MTRKSWVNAFICGSHICSVQPSEFDSIRVGPPSRPSTETLSRQPSASIIGIYVPPHARAKARGASSRQMTRASIERRVYSRRWIAGSSPATTSGLLFLERGEQAVDQGLRGALIGHRLERTCPAVRPRTARGPWILFHDPHA